MFNPKPEVFKKLKELDVEVFQGSKAVFEKLPCITFRVDDNTPRYFVEGTISHQDITIVIDIWTKSSTKASTLLNSVEEKLREIGYLMEFSTDVPNPDPTLYHVNCRFETKK